MEDSILVEQILKHGKTQLYALIVKKYEGAVFAKTLGITKRTDAAKELTQQTFIRTYTRLADFRGRELGPWITAIACHLSLNHLEKEKRQRAVSIDTADRPADDYDGEREALLRRMEQAIDELPEEDRRIIRLHYYQKEKTDAIARLTGLTQTNVLVRLHRIRERLKKKLEHETD